MENILNKVSDNNDSIEQLKYELKDANSINSDSDIGEDDDSRDAALAIEENILKGDVKMERADRSGVKLEIKDEVMDTDIILPEAPQNVHSNNKHSEKKRKMF